MGVGGKALGPIQPSMYAIATRAHAVTAIAATMIATSTAVWDRIGGGGAFMGPD
jgi:hypothetical protein